MKKKFVCIVIILVFSVLVIINAFYRTSGFERKDIVGRNVTSIVEEYGQFDKVFYNESGDQFSGWYTIRERAPGIIAMKSAKYFVIDFEDGIAVDAYEIESDIGG